MTIQSSVQNYQTDISKLLLVLEKYVNDTDMAEIKNIVGEIQNRISRFRNESR